MAAKVGEEKYILKNAGEEDGIIKKSKIELRLKHIREVIGLMNEKWLRKIDI